jgi:succinyl-CoA synthetase beta subunit
MATPRGYAMNLFEFQAKELISRFGIEIPRGRVAGSPDDAERVARRLAFPRFAIKAQIHGGGRGLAGGVKFATSPQEARAVATQLLARPLVTVQTKATGETVRWVYVEEAFDIRDEIYAAVVVDRTAGALMLMVSAAGGEDVEAQAAADPSVLARFPIDISGPQPVADFAGAARAVGLAGSLAATAADVFAKMTRVALELDATLVEINPLAITMDGRLITLDAKLSVDANALFRHPALAALRAQIQIDDGDPRELAADRHQINFQRLDGTIGVVCNGAGLALATNDMLIDAGGRPASFMDIRTTASSLDIAYGLGMILDNPAIRVILINIHGGGMQRCDTVAEGLAVAMRRATRAVPLVVRFAGNNADFARVRLKGAGVTFIEALDLADAVARTMAVYAKDAA